MIRIYRIAKYERGLLFRDRDFVEILQPGRYVYFDPLLRMRVEVEDVTESTVTSPWLEQIVASKRFGAEAIVVNLTDGERALVWIDGRLASILTPGLHAFWTVLKPVRIERVDAARVRFEHGALAEALELGRSDRELERVDVDANTVGLFYLNGVLQEMLSPGRYAFWKGQGKVEVRPMELREQVLDVTGQDIMTSDKVTLRLNAVITYAVRDPEKTVNVAADHGQTIYREVQLALRAVVGTRPLDALLDEKDAVVQELESLVSPRLSNLGIEIVSLGIRDIILPGEMKLLLNQVTEARKAAEANLITRREETAAVRSQLNAARLLESNPTLMRLRELEVLEKVTEKASLNVVLGDGGLAERVVKLL